MLEEEEEEEEEEGRVILHQLLFVAGMIEVLAIPLQKPPPISPCPSVFTYALEEKTGAWKGIIVVTPTKLPLHVRVELFMKGQLSEKKYNGALVLAENEDMVRERLLAKDYSLVKYNLYFSPHYLVPLVQRILVNGKIVCQGPDKFYIPLISGRVVTEIVMDHILQEDDPSIIFGDAFSDNSRCGLIPTAKPLILHSTATSRGQWPWHAAIYKNGLYLCAGALITQSAVLTVAHCVTNSEVAEDHSKFTVHLGKYHLRKEDDGAQEAKVDKIYVHPSFNSTTFYSDLAVLRLASPVTLTEYVTPVCLESGIDVRSFEEPRGYVAGWGMDEQGAQTEDLRMAIMPIVPQEVCLRSYPEFFGYFSNNKTFCAGNRNGTSPCNGDSGGAMVQPRSADNGTQVWFLRGLVSLSVSKVNGTKRICNSEHYTVFTDVTKHLRWISQHIK
ncbi:chymotrypsin-like protease CTRL-1 [Anabrus simplex]|uniref:chymotrypsin-like protease CTRL-1 n=1 Tax=Anabrus simplex TaxID=316456 RepID=UPI0035A35515